MSTAVTVVDAGIGNLGAIPNMLKRLNTQAIVTDDLDRIAQAERLILPGVGSFDAAMQRLEERGLVEVLNTKALADRIPVLGVCLGMELMGGASEEGSHRGLGWIQGRAVKFRFDSRHPGLKVPHMGWNVVRPADGAPLLADLGERPRFYFAHSYHLECDDPADVIGTTTYGYEFVSAVQRENIAGIQFHPEKSHRFGLRIFENFLAL
jgi:glutamine amidotransferase